eukprot:GEMP01005998.1.p1 GENE.GEMP01005998.1~~GEMP01005998.1.p1  ORF type:complete len:764 (+),score=150.07 GEMP01005998.1:184-2475(+)
MATYLDSLPPRADLLSPRRNGHDKDDSLDTPRQNLLDILRMRIFSGGPSHVVSFAMCLANASEDRLLDIYQFRDAINMYLDGGDFQPGTDAIDALFDSFLQCNSGRLSYDDFVHAIKFGLSPERKDVVRAAFRRLDHDSEGLVDFSYMMSCYNAGRHPLCGKVGDAVALMQDFENSIHDFLCFRRGEKRPQMNAHYVAWEEFEDYFTLINGCFDDDLFQKYVLRCWDIDKEQDRVPVHDIEKTSAAPAAGIPPKSRVDLHHWQTNTLPNSDTFRKADIQLDHVFTRAREAVGRFGVRHAFNVVQNFVAVDDNMDDMVDLCEFRKASRPSNIRFSDDEEEQIFKDMGKDVTQPNGVVVRLLPIFAFLERLHGPISNQRRLVVERAWKSFDRETVPPSELRKRFDGASHPLVARGLADPHQVLTEFLDTFSLLMQIISGTIDGEIVFTGFAAYYRIVSSTILPDKDAYFDVLVSRVWRLDGEGIDKHISPRTKSPMAERRPPLTEGPSAYTMNEKDFHRRYVRSDSPTRHSARNSSRSVRSNGTMNGTDPSTFVYSTPITKSNILFNDATKSEAREIVKRLARNISRRGLKGWTLFVQSIKKYDDGNNGQLHKQQFDRLLKTLGLGVSPEEKDELVRCLLTDNGTLDYVALISSLKGEMSQDRQKTTINLFHRLKQDSDLVFIDDMMKQFKPQAYPSVILGTKNLQEAAVDFQEGLKLCAGGQQYLDICAFFDFFSIVNVVFSAEDEFRLMSGSIFGHAPNDDHR